jgi:hypothetical protein
VTIPRGDDATFGLISTRIHVTWSLAVGSAYGWADYTSAMPDEEVLQRLLALNHERAAAEAAASGWRRELAQASEARRGAVATVVTPGGQPMVRPVAFVFADESGVRWVEPGYADPVGTPSPAVHQCEGRWLTRNMAQGSDRSVELSPCDPGDPVHAPVGAALEGYSRWLAGQGKTWEGERKAMWKLVKPPKR